MTEQETAALMRAIAPAIAAHVQAATQPRIIALAQCVTELTQRVCELEAELRKQR